MQYFLAPACSHEIKVILSNESLAAKDQCSFFSLTFLSHNKSKITNLRYSSVKFHFDKTGAYLYSINAELLYSVMNFYWDSLYSLLGFKAVSTSSDMLNEVQLIYKHEGHICALSMY